MEIIEGAGETKGVYTVRVTGRDGAEIVFNTTENTAIQEREDGGLDVTLQESGKRYVLSPDGTMRTVDETESVGNSGDDILININGETVDGGEGNDLIFNFASNASIVGGEGNDTVVLGNDVENLQVDTGNGDDTVRGFSADNARIALGDGNNRLSNLLLERVSILFGSSNNVTAAAESNERVAETSVTFAKFI